MMSQKDDILAPGDKDDIWVPGEKPASRFIAAVRKFDKVLFTVESTLGVIVIAIMTLVVFFSVIMRFFFSMPNMWVEELPRFMMVWAAYLGVACGCRTRSHLYVEGFVNALPTPVGKAVRVIVRLVIIVVFAIFFFICLDLTLTQKRLGQTSPAMTIPMWVIYLSLLIGFSCSVITELMLFANDFLAKKPFLDDMRKRVTE